MTRAPSRPRIPAWTCLHQSPDSRPSFPARRASSRAGPDRTESGRTARPTRADRARSFRRLLDPGRLGPLLDHSDGVIAVALVLVALAGGGDHLTVGRLEPPAILVPGVL